MVTNVVVNYYILPIDVNAVKRQNVVVTTFCNATTFWIATLLNDPKGPGDLCRRFDLGVLTPKGQGVIRGCHDLLYDPKGNGDSLT